MIGRTVAVLALTASCVVTSVTPSVASSKGGYPGWYDVNGTAAQSRANLIENVLTPSAVTTVKYLRSVVTPVITHAGRCGTPEEVNAPLPAGGYLYAVTSGKLSEYDPATGKLLWRVPPPVFRTASPADFSFGSLAISGNMLIATAYYCIHANYPSVVAAYNATTGKLLWLSNDLEGLNQPNSVAVAGSYIIAEGEDRSGVYGSVLKLSNGAPVWNFSPCQSSAPLVVGGLVMTPNADCTSFEAQNLASGNVVWSLSGGWTPQAGDLSGSAGAYLYVTDPSGTVEDLDPQTGQVQYSLSGAITVLAVDLSRVYATCGPQGESLCAYNIGDGALEWQDSYLITGDANGIVLAAEADGVLYLDTGVALNAATGQAIKTLWSGSNGTASELAVGNGRIAVVSDPRVLDLFGLPGE